MILHLDMDAFFASVEQRDHPELRGKPVIIGGRSQRAVVSTASYEARVYGVHSAMPLFEAMKRCPSARVIRGDMGRYRAVSRRIFSLLEQFSPSIEPVSIDEAYVDIAGCERIFGPPREMARQIKAAIVAHEHLTCSIGISPLKFLSKIASDMNKPDGITLIGPDEVDGVIARLPIRKVPGVGDRTFDHLQALGVKTLGDVARLSDHLLTARLGAYGLRLKQLSRGIDHNRVCPVSERKSISTETTLDRDTGDREALARLLLVQADEVARQLRKETVKARVVTLKITFPDFRQITRRHTLDVPTQSARDIYREVMRLFENESFGAVRLIGLGAAGLLPEHQPVQAGLFDNRENPSRARWEKAERAVDSIVGKYGKALVNRAAAVLPAKNPVSDDPDR
jgi:DNA polymerase-4